jgi:hypothetical protein
MHAPTTRAIVATMVQPVRLALPALLVLLIVPSAAEAQQGAGASAGTISSQVTRLLENVALSAVQQKKVDSIAAWATTERTKLIATTGTPTTGRKRHVSIERETVGDLHALAEQWPKAIRDVLTPAQQKTWDANRRAMQARRDGDSGVVRPAG